MTDRLFVYGTLAPGRPNEHVLAGMGGTWASGVVQGDLTEHGWGATMGYPALVMRADGPDVAGFVFTCATLADHWPELDEFEGSGYERVITTVRLDDGETVSAHIYVAKL